ncbi:polyketide cyclase [Paenibacillus swuensis]|uniref:Polyketide cyclase n=1 Tax=Paenibacillus swuensis TaxID=1178515 RepID=A0A172TJ62_9BACL|nr:SRPBCC domain-containing protein [Paenibacillus swuensis]ANE46887.1 polyketide cyclase [Paenibacillus swuensis]
MDLRYEFYINATREDVWHALISTEGTKALLFGSVLKSDFNVGDSYAYVGPGNEGEDTVHVYGTILAYEPNVQLSLLEHPGPSYRENHEELQSRITFMLETVGQCTKLTLINDQWTENHPSRESTEKSWWMILSNLKTYVETGKTLDFGW